MADDLGRCAARGGGAGGGLGDCGGGGGVRAGRKFHDTILVFQKVRRRFVQRSRILIVSLGRRHGHLSHLKQRYDIPKIRKVNLGGAFPVT